MFIYLKSRFVKLRRMKINLSDDVKEEMKKLREELAEMKEKLANISQKEQHGHERGHIQIDIGKCMPEYVEDMMEDVAEGIHGELEKSILIGPGGVRIIKERDSREDEDKIEVDLHRAAEIMSALGEEHRLSLLKELVSGGKYINELQENLHEITTSTLSSHLKILEEAGLVVQEKVRGRYLITMPGRVAYKMAKRVTSFLERGEQE